MQSEKELMERIEKLERAQKTLILSYENRINFFLESIAFLFYKELESGALSEFEFSSFINSLEKIDKSKDSQLDIEFLYQAVRTFRDYQE